MNAELENVEVEQLEIEDREGVRALPGAAEILHAVPSARMAIVTSATRALAVARMGYAGLPIPQNMITSENVVRGKPFPEPYVKGARLLGFAPTIVFSGRYTGRDWLWQKSRHARGRGPNHVFRGQSCRQLL